MDGGQHPVPLTEQTVKNQQGEGRLGRVGIDDDVTESAEVLKRQS